PNPDFTLSDSPSSQSVQAGGSASYTTTLTALNGFSDPVTLSATGLPNGATASFSPASVNGSGTSQLTIKTTALIASGSYPFTVTATSGSLTHTANLTLVVNAAADFSLAFTPSTQSVQLGSTANYTVTIAAQNGYASATNLALTGLPAGATATFTPQSVTGSGSARLVVSTSATTPVGTYQLTITASGGTLAHSASATLVVSPVADFAITASPASQSLQPGTSTTYTISIAGQSGYSGVANLLATGLPAGATATFNPISVNGTGSAQLTITTIGATQAGTYPITVTATSGTETHAADVTLIVSPAIQHSVALSWVDTDSTIAGYNVYRSNQS